MTQTSPARKEVEIKALKMLVEAIHESVKTAGPLGVPEGHLYATLMTIPNFSLDHFNTILTVMTEAGKITRKNFVVRAR